MPGNPQKLKASQTIKIWTVCTIICSNYASSFHLPVPEGYLDGDLRSRARIAFLTAFLGYRKDVEMGHYDEEKFQNSLLPHEHPENVMLTSLLQALNHIALDCQQDGF